MRTIFRIMINNNDPRIMDEDEMIEDVYEKLDELESRIIELINITKKHNSTFYDDNHIKF